MSGIPHRNGAHGHMVKFVSMNDTGRLVEKAGPSHMNLLGGERLHSLWGQQKKGKTQWGGGVIKYTVQVLGFFYPIMTREYNLLGKDSGNTCTCHARQCRLTRAVWGMY